VAVCSVQRECLATHVCGVLLVWCGVCVLRLPRPNEQVHPPL
jgi:hypothetical protein